MIPTLFALVLLAPVPQDPLPTPPTTVPAPADPHATPPGAPLAEFATEAITLPQADMAAAPASPTTPHSFVIVRIDAAGNAALVDPARGVDDDQEVVSMAEFRPALARFADGLRSTAGHLEVDASAGATPPGRDVGRVVLWADRETTWRPVLEALEACRAAFGPIDVVFAARDASGAIGTVPLVAAAPSDARPDHLAPNDPRQGEAARTVDVRILPRAEDHDSAALPEDRADAVQHGIGEDGLYPTFHGLWQDGGGPVVVRVHPATEQPFHHVAALANEAARFGFGLVIAPGTATDSGRMADDVVYALDPPLARGGATPPELEPGKRFERSPAEGRGTRDG